MKYITLIIGFIMVTSCSQFGSRPKGEDQKKLIESKNYNEEKGFFENRRADILKEMKSKTSTWKIMKLWFGKEGSKVPEGKLPEIEVDLEKFLAPTKSVRSIWFGHSTFLLNFAGTIILVDPVLSGSAAPVSFMVKRFQKPVLSLKQLPEIDYILISHDHYDHLDMESIKFFADKKAKFITPLGVGSHIAGWGIERSRIIEKDWWEDVSFGELKFICTPAQHFSGRDGIHENETLWASWVIQNPDNNIYFSGDSGFDTHFKEIGARLGPFDIAYLETGQYNENWREVHMFPEEAIQAFNDLKAKKYFPVHWGMFELSLHEWNEPILALEQLTQEKPIELVIPKFGEIVDIKESFSLSRWWK